MHYRSPWAAAIFTACAVTVILGLLIALPAWHRRYGPDVIPISPATTAAPIPAEPTPTSQEVVTVTILTTASPTGRPWVCGGTELAGCTNEGQLDPSVSAALTAGAYSTAMPRASAHGSR